MGHFFFFFFVFLLPFVYCCAFILFSLFLPLVFLVSIFIHFMSPMFHIFSLLCKQKYKVYNTEQKNYLFFPSKKKEKNFPKKSYYDIKLLCNLYKIIYMCLPSYQKKNKERSILSVKKKKKKKKIFGEKKKKKKKKK